MEQVGCGKIWGGNKDADIDLCTSSLETSLLSLSCDGGKGGDIYYYSVCKTDRLSRIVLGDVVGHGEAVSHISSWVYDALKSHMNKLEGNEILNSLNNTIYERGLDAMTTAAVIAYYLGDHNFYFSYAGHYPALLRRMGETEWSQAEIQTPGNYANLPLGINRDIHYDQQHLKLGTGDCLFLYTDGVTEAQDTHYELFGMERLIRVLNAIPENDPQIIKKTVLKKIRDYCDGSLNHDDITAIAIKIH